MYFIETYSLVIWKRGGKLRDENCVVKKAYWLQVYLQNGKTGKQRQQDLKWKPSAWVFYYTMPLHLRI